MFILFFSNLELCTCTWCFLYVSGVCVCVYIYICNHIVFDLQQVVTMPELTELDKATASMTERRGGGSGSGTESDSDDTIPELEEPGTGHTSGVFSGAAAAGLPIDMVSKAKQSRGEKKARKIMSKLGLKPVCYSFKYCRFSSM
jgi:hypothetical protein